MALFSELPVYKLGYDLLIAIYQRTSKFTREYKYTMGERLKNETLELLLSIYKANKSEKDHRLHYIDTARQRIEIVRLLLRICKDLKVIGMKGFVALNVQVEELSRQLTAWHKFTARAHANE
ncbi:four helix bundle protein [Natronogracilivirga saccharolytica]|uniref:Four helix bundle protein n=1 Tax=Natronogracilivirga saccharolytica TaxID=2812953 RepID=A0A8J7S9Q0_9BACT|nr:four helix bundle protein [Natronogracilivirga saccharolytica]MBP3192983.1 four helix bundle protein [Natronogracilivirga saccharolytica]